MPVINAQGKIFRSWEGLLNACQTQAAQLPNMEPLRGDLQDILTQSRQVKAQQEANEALRQGSTQQLADLIARGQEAARRLRVYAKSQLGTKNELLVQFGTAPIRPRGRSTQTTAKKPAPDTPAAPPEAASKTT
jgi:hypothetical protein